MVTTLFLIPKNNVVTIKLYTLPTYIILPII